MDCVRTTGFLFWKKPCGRPSIGACDYCRTFICQMHGNIRGDGSKMCNECFNRSTQDDDAPASIGTQVAGSLLAAGFTAAQASSISDGDSSSSSDSGSSDSGGDSGGSDSGGSDSSSSSC